MTTATAKVEQFKNGNDTRTGKFFIGKEHWIEMDKSYQTREEAEQAILKKIQKNPFNTHPWVLVEVLEAYRSEPVAETTIKKVSLQEALTYEEEE